MVLQVHGFDWTAYAEHVMPAFEQWLVRRDESAIYRLFKETRCAREEAFIPPALQRARIWPRAKAFAETLPLGPYSRREYQKLCSAEHFTALSDRYMYRHAPRLYQNPEPIRAVWGALIETYCLPWSRDELKQSDAQERETVEVEEEEEPMLSGAQVERSEVLSLLREAGLGELAREMNEQARLSTERLREAASGSDPETQPLSSGHTSSSPAREIGLAPSGRLEDEPLEDEEEDREEYTCPMPGGITLGAHPNVLQLRGWLAGISVRALALFEYLACGRRSMPFGYEPSEPYGVFIGYLTPDEVWRLGICLRDVQDPDQAEAEADYLRFRYQHPGVPESYRLIDEILPSCAAEFHQAVDMAAAQGLGLICSME
jgi:phage terminase small subunit